MISAIVPLYNEEKSLPFLHKELTVVLSRLAKSYEVIYVDDGSTDASLSVLKNLASKQKNIRIFSLLKNQGKAEALSLGFEKAKGEYIVTLDADLQDKPAEIGKLLVKIKEGFDVVGGWRKNRKDAKTKVISSKIFNSIAGIFWGLHLHDYNCGLKAFTKDSAKQLHLYGGMHRFIPLLAYQKGFRVGEVVVEHDKRKFGKSKYGFSKIFKDLPDILTMLFLTRYSHRPLHFFGMIGGILFLIGFLILLYLSIIHFQGQAIGRRPLLFFGGLFVLGGLQILFTGFLADLLLNLSKNGNQEMPLRYSSEK